ncbi:class I SAM-dependent methyltransferase [Ruegeria sp. Ofav3-42]|uniref:class I SAM-dependent methyltransferase n=1 Tax=Ruegeria sp. Ofav3-42 TaxID=2917759 RepID=UPI001EF62685|nr:class I SAM-dependent methyltransferase [Ruegeria sp. Ofav3-42]
MTPADITTVGEAPGTACPSCGQSGNVLSLYDLAGIPVQSTLLLPDRATALGFPTGDMALCWCPNCGLAFNARFDLARVDYGTGYEDAQGGSPTFNAFVSDLAQGWIERFSLGGGHLIEVGCGKGDFLRLICAQGDCSGTGYDPAYVPGRSSEPDGLTFHAENFTKSHVPVDADFLICRHTLEHIGDVAGFLALMRQAAGDGTRLRYGIEVPDLRRILIEGAFWDIYYEHASYFTAGSLARAFRLAGFEVLDLRRVYGEQYLIIEAAVSDRPSPLPELADDLAETTKLVAEFRDTARSRIDGWRQRFAAWHDAGKRVALWGSGSKAVGFLTTIGDPGIVSCVVDINPSRQGHYMPGCAAPIAAPETLTILRPDIVIVMNSIYRDEIAAQIASMQLSPEILTTDTTPEMEPTQ